MINEFKDVTTPSGRMRVHLCQPAVDGCFPGVVLYSEIYQITAPIRRLAAIIAGHGYAVAMPEVYHEYEPAGRVLAYDQIGTDRGNALKVEKPVSRASMRTPTQRYRGWLGIPQAPGASAHLESGLEAILPCAPS